MPSTVLFGKTLGNGTIVPCAGGQITHYFPTGRPEVTSEPLVIALVYPARTIRAIDEGSFARPD